MFLHNHETNLFFFYMDFSFSYNDYFSLLKNLPFFLQGVSSISRSWVDLMSTFFFLSVFWILSYIRWKCETIVTCDERPSCKQMSFMMIFTNEIVYYKFPRQCLEKSSQFMVFYLKAHMWKAISTHFHNKYNELSTTVWNQTSAVSSLRTQNKKQQQKKLCHKA